MDSQPQARQGGEAAWEHRYCITCGGFLGPQAEVLQLGELSADGLDLLRSVLKNADGQAPDVKPLEIA